jgi:hypothetical protein
LSNAGPHNLRCDASWRLAGESLTPYLQENPLGRKRVPVQRTLKRELKELEIVKREAIEVSRSISLWEKFSFLMGASLGGRVGRGMVGQPIISILIRLALSV